MSDENFKNVFSKNLKKYMDQYEINNAELSRILGVSESTVGKWVLKKAVPRMGIVEKLSIIFHIEKSDLIEDKTDKQSSLAKGVRIPVLGRVAAGIPIEAITDIEDWEEVPSKMAAGGEYFALRIKGSSMEPKLLDGDIVIVRKQNDVDNGDTAIVLVNGDEATVKQIKKTDTGIILVGLNVEVYQPHFYTNKEIEQLPVQIIGKVIESRHTW